MTLVGAQFVAAAAIPPITTELAPCVAPKFLPDIVTSVPGAPELGARFVISGNVLVDMPSHATSQINTTDIKSPRTTARDMRTERNLAKSSMLRVGLVKSSLMETFLGSDPSSPLGRPKITTRAGTSPLADSAQSESCGTRISCPRRVNSQTGWTRLAVSPRLAPQAGP